MFKLQKTRIQNTPFAVYISDTSVTLKKSQGHQTYNDSVDPKQGVITMQSWKILALTESEKKSMLIVFKQENSHSLCVSPRAHLVVGMLWFMY